MKVYHRTPYPDSILANGFCDSEGTYMTCNLYRGVWFSNEPLDCNESAMGWTVFSLDIPDEVFEKYEWVEDWKGYRESLIPADAVNLYGPPVIHDDDFKDFTREEVEQYAARVAEFDPDEAQELREHIAFLKQHGLLQE